MKDSVVLYYSKSGNNRFLSEKIAQNINCDLEEIKPRIKNLLTLILSLFLPSMGIKKIKTNIADYNKIILVGPIWMGNIASPIKDFIKKYNSSINQLYLISCCGGGESSPDDKFGYNTAFSKIKKIVGDKLILSEAYPTYDVISKEFKDDKDLIMNTKLSNNNFTGEILEKFDNLISKLK